jgi:hypothetical protein
MRGSKEGRPGALALALAGLFFVLYPTIRPFSDESSLAGAKAFSSGAWVIAHLLAVMAFILFTLGLLDLALRLRAKLAWWSLIVSWSGVGLTLPYYGAEVFGLHAIGTAAVKEHDVALLRLADATRLGPGFVVIVAGLLLLTVGTILAEIAIWRSRNLPRWSGVPLVIGFALYLPQYLASQPVRIAHAALVAAGCFWTAWGLWSRCD